MVPGHEPGMTAEEGADRRASVRCCVYPGGGQELLRLQAGAADQRPVNVIDPHELAGVRRLHRAPVEDANGVAFRAVTADQPLADEPLRRRAIGSGWGCAP